MCPNFQANATGDGGQRGVGTTPGDGEPSSRKQMGLFSWHPACEVRLRPLLRSLGIVRRGFPVICTESSPVRVNKLNTHSAQIPRSDHRVRSE